ncbi:Zinc finger MYM-type protein 4 [Collichthys lucidus]|uniref:Zinc finger MYM-type protein 4 n=1 Tax=Collichthys lucidus TaxID=240159 RepID=A0A4U5VPI6_COLLU|nr:Zinc finger MYM-type protein 4 [Collichthys lucidus]
MEEKIKQLTPEQDALEAEDSEAASSLNNSSFDDDSDDGELSESGPSRKNSQRDSSPFRDFSRLDETSCTQQEEEEAVSSSEEHGWDEDFIPRKPIPKLTKPSFTSKNYCYVCGKGFSKISRHLLTHADIEPEIAEASALPLCSKERKRVFDTFRNRGNYKHNQEVLKNQHGALKLKRRPLTAHARASSHVYCLYCKGMLQHELEPDGEQYDSENSDAEEDEEESDLQQSDVVEQEAVKKKQKTQPSPEQDAEEHIKAGRDKPFLEEMFIDHQKGRGVFTRESIEPSTFVVEYRGKLLLNKESGKSKHGDTLKNYLYDFSWDGKNWRLRMQQPIPQNPALTMNTNQTVTRVAMKVVPAPTLRRVRGPRKIQTQILLNGGALSSGSSLITALMTILALMEMTWDILEPDGQPDVEPNEVSDVEADEEQENPENRDAEKDNGLSELSLQLSGLFCFSTPKKPRRVSSSRKRRKSKTHKQESEAEPSELNDERNNEVNSEQDDDEMPESCDVDTPEKTVETTEDASKMWSAPIPWIPVEQDATKHDNDSSDTKKTNSPPNMDTAVSDHEESKDVDEVNDVEQKSRSSSGIANTEKNKKLLAAMKEVKILVKRLDIGTLRFPVQVSKLSSVCNSDNEKKKSEQLYVKDQTVHDDCNKSPTPSTSTKDKPSSAKEVQMICSHCKKSMLKGQTAYQKKGFTDVFCSKNCLFALFPVNKPVTKTCHNCHQAISQPLDLIMAAVDIKGTMKEFCGINCLCAFKYNTVPTQPTQTICRTCKKTCTTTHDFTLHNVIHKFCSDACLQDFRSENVFTCANCTSTCLHKPLTLKLEGEETKTICSDECLDQFKEVQIY